MHTPSNPPALQKIVSTLLELTNTSIAELARQAGLHRPNLVSWLGGKAHVLALPKQLQACETLGWRDGRLLRSRIHRWQIGNQLDLLREALDLLEPKDTRWGLISMHGGKAENGGILLSLPSESPSQSPLTILLARPASHSILSPLTGMLPPDILVCATSVPMSLDDWSIWWEDTENHDAQILLDTTARFAWGTLQFSNQDQSPRTTDQDEKDCLELLRSARAKGLDLNELKSRIRDWIAKS